MGIQPLLATHRLIIEYDVDGFVHKSQSWCRAITSSDITGYDVVARAGFSNSGISSVVDKFHTVAAPFFDPTLASPALATLYDFAVPSAPVPLASYLTSVVYSGSGSYSKAYAAVVFMRDTGQIKMPMPFFEYGFGVLSFKNTNYAALSSAAKTLVNYATNGGGTAVAVDAYAWRQSRAARYARQYLSLVWDTNEKLRRKRGIK